MSTITKIARSIYCKLTLVRRAGLFRLGDESVRTLVNLVNARNNPALQQAPHPTEIERPYPFLKYLPQVLIEQLGKSFPATDLQLTLIDTKHGLICSQMPVTAPNGEKIERARQRVVAASKDYGYEGFSEEIDRSYDPNSVYFIVENRHGEVVAAARMSRKTADNRMPLEDGLKLDGSRYCLPGKEERVGEINSFFYKRRQAGGTRRAVLELLFAALGRYSWLMGFEHVYCLADADHQKTQDLYLKAGFKFSQQFAERIYFPEFGRSKNNAIEPTQWTVMEMSRTMIIFHALKGINYLSI